MPHGINAGMKILPPAMVKKPELSANVLRMLSKISVTLLKAVVPRDLINILEDDANVKVPLTYGGVENKFFSEFLPFNRVVRTTC